MWLHDDSITNLYNYRQSRTICQGCGGRGFEELHGYEKRNLSHYFQNKHLKMFIIFSFEDQNFYFYWSHNLKLWLFTPFGPPNGQ